MEGQFPKNVKQVGNVSDSPKIYVEDYVDTYFSQLTEQGRESLVGVFLIGKNTVIEEQECIFVTGAVQMKDLDTEAKELSIGEEHLEMAKTESRDYFHGEEIIGWMLFMPGHPVGLSSSMIRVHEKLFPMKNSLFILRDAEGEELLYAYKFHELMQMGGHYIFYEKNPDMQNYMISERKQIGVTPSEVVEDRAAKDFRSTVRGRMEVREQRRESRYVYLTSVLLVIVVLAIGISTMNNYDKMNSVQTSIETLSSAMQQSSSDDEGQAEREAPKIQGNIGEEGQENIGLQAEEQQMEPAVSTVQEELDSEEDYYIVQKGDTLDIISEKVYGTISKTDAIRQKNGLEDGNLIIIGQKLLLP
ncbi:MAG: LysM peptidoglycan-binding domain-containing protein [Dorea sp.]|nr:LysM peptidoglycan-binding domain-containing protein [Dorea sp.]